MHREETDDHPSPADGRCCRRALRSLARPHLGFPAIVRAQAERSGSGI